MTLAYYFDGGLAITSLILFGITAACVLAIIVTTIAAFVRPRWGFYGGVRFNEPSDAYAAWLVVSAIVAVVCLLVVAFLWPFQWDRDNTARDVREGEQAIAGLHHNYRTTIKRIHSFTLGKNDTGAVDYSTKSGKECSATASLRPLLGWTLRQTSVKCSVFEQGAYPGAEGSP